VEIYGPRGAVDDKALSFAPYPARGSPPPLPGGGGATPGGVVGKSVMLEWGTQEPD